MPRITKKMKMEELKQGEDKLINLVMMCNGLNVNPNGNVLDEYGKTLMIPVIDNKGVTDKKFLKYGDGPFKFKERKFDPINNYKLMVMLFNDFIAYIMQEEADSENDEKSSISVQSMFYNIQTITLREGDMINADTGQREKYVELRCDKSGSIESERYICPSLGYIELMFAYSGILPEYLHLLRRVDELKNELEL